MAPEQWLAKESLPATGATAVTGWSFTTLLDLTV
jgi:hypothetical protein